MHGFLDLEECRAVRLLMVCFKRGVVTDCRNSSVPATADPRGSAEHPQNQRAAQASLGRQPSPEPVRSFQCYHEERHILDLKTNRQKNTIHSFGLG